MSLFISIEGNIGSGKSTLVRKLRDFFKDTKQVYFLDEPVDEWLTLKDKEGEDILTKFYSNTKKYAFSFQMMAYISRISILRKALKEHPNSILISERSVLTDRNVFAKMLYEDDLIEEVNYQIYLKWFDEFLEDVKINKLIYINTEPAKCKERILKRNRPGEKIELSYLERCHKYHNDWLKDLKFRLELDGNEDKKDDDYEEWFKQIISYIYSGNEKHLEL